MKIEVRFTVDVEQATLPALRKVAEVDTNVDAASFVRNEAEEYLLGYLFDHGVNATVTRRDGAPA